jgi:CTP synthase
MKYIFVTGGVLSGLGKGITTASIGRMLRNRGYRVTVLKIDPYINIDAGTMNPFQHGEVYVLKDGGEVDLDLGHYERFLNIELTSDHNITTGKVYLKVIEEERKGVFLGKTVQIIPHITDEIKKRIREVADKSDADICIIELGGTVGDIEGMPFLESVRQIRREEEKEDTLLVHVTLVPVNNIGEQKTKPTQHSVRELKSTGLQPDVIVGRCKDPLTTETKSKIALFCDIAENAVISNYDSEDIYLVPMMLETEGLGDYIVEKLNIEKRRVDTEWYNKVEAYNNVKNKKKIKVAIVAKYGFEDAYLSIKEALRHSCINNNCDHIIDIQWIDAENLEKEPMLKDFKGFEDIDGILVPGGFGIRGAEGKINAIRYARETDIPFLGICFGFQLAVIEFSRNVLKIDATSREFEEDNQESLCNSNFVIDLLPEQKSVNYKGGTMRLGESLIYLKKDSLVYRLYNRDKIYERHRHRYEVNPNYLDLLQKEGLKFSGKDGERVEVLEIPDKRFFLATQYHPEFKSNIDNPSPVFLGFVNAMIDYKKEKDNKSL